MCLIAFAYKAHPNYKLLLVANRDEYHHRPTRHADYWPDSPNTLGGQDLQAGGSWLAINRQGRFATVTNYREGESSTYPLSRGELVTGFVQSSASPTAWINQLENYKNNYGGFNLLTGTTDQLYYTSNREAQTIAIKPGIYSLSNHLLNSPWPKAEQAKQKLSKMLSLPKLAPDQLSTLLSSQQGFADELLPKTGISLEVERILSAPFINGAEYGTRCTTVLAWGEDDQITFIEQNYLADAIPAERRCFNFKIEADF